MSDSAIEDVMKRAHSSSTDIKNGSIIVSTPSTGEVEKRDPDLNKFTASGVFVNRLNTRLDEDYGGGPS
jgi:hypothetical protein